MTTPQDPPVRRRQKARRAKQLTAWRVKNEGKPPSKAAAKRLARPTGDGAEKKAKKAAAAKSVPAKAAAKPAAKPAAKKAESAASAPEKKAAKTK